MDPPPIAAVTTTTTTQLNYPDSTNSSPPSRPADMWDQPLPPVPGAKMRLMCSYGGHIIPRPHDKSLCYVGGDTRMVVVDRNSSLSDLSSRLSRTLFHGRHFTLKYQLPNEDLDSLVSVTTDEDLENMIEEYDRTTSPSPLKPSRLRLFLFLSKPETAASMGSLLDDAKSETWFVDALNYAAFIPRGLSDSAATEHLHELERIANSDSCNDLEAQNEPRQVKNLGDVQSITTSDSPFVETNSSFGSGSSSSMSNLPPIRVRVEDGGNLQDQMVGLDEQLSQMSVVTAEQKQDEGFVLLSAPPPLPVLIGATVAPPVNRVASNENMGRVFSDDERSDQGAPSGFRKPPLPLQPIQRKVNHDAYNLPSPDSKQPGGYNLPSPDSVASDTSITSANSLSKHAYYQDSAPNTTRPPTGLISPTNANNSDPNSQIQIQHQVQDPSLYMQPPQQQQHYFHTGNAPYMHHPGSGQVPMSSYYQMYAPPPQQQQPYQQQVDQQQYQMYLMPVTQQAQTYNMTMQSGPTDSQPVNPQNPANAYKETTLPLYQSNQPEMGAGSTVYRTAGPTMVPVTNQTQQQYVNLSHQMAHLPQSSAAGGGNYGYEYTHPTNEQVYYGQHLVAPVAPQYQTMSPATAVMLAQASAQQAADNTKQQMG